MMKYRPDQFASTYMTPTGQKLWRFLNGPEIIARMEAASEMGKPAAEGIEEPLLEEFREAILDDRTKQMCGHMIRQILEARGWVIDRGDAKVFSIPFIKATRYRRPNWYLFHVYRNSNDARQICLTNERNGGKLPVAPKGRWLYWTSFSSPMRGAIAFDLLNQDAARQAVLANGYFLHRIKRSLRAA
jgi:hypothetical protein